MLSVISRVPRGPALLVCAVLLGLAAGCSGEDLAKANYQRTTVSAEPGTASGDVPTGPIDDPAVGLAALRTVDPCAVLSQDTLAGLGTRTGEPYQSEWGQCRVDVQDAGGKVIGLGLDLGEAFVIDDRASGAVEGLPLIEEQADDTTCLLTAVTSRDPGLGIGLQVNYEGGGNPCGPGYTALQRVLQLLHDNPPQYEQPPGSLLAVDPCGTAGRRALDDVLGAGAAGQPQGLHQCQYSVDGRGPTVTVRFRSGYPPTPDDGAPADLGRGVTAIQEQSTVDGPVCEAGWQHLATGEEGASELVAVEFYGNEGDGTKQQACERAVTVARSVVPNLPRP